MSVRKDHSMNRTILGAGVAALALATAAVAAPASAAKPRASMLSIQLNSPQRPVSVSKMGKIPVNVKIAGIMLNAKLVGMKNKAGVGHYHFYVDCIPADGYRTADLARCWAGAATSAMASFDLSTSKVKVTPGTHLLLVALARNNHVLYKAPASAIVFTAK